MKRLLPVVQNLSLALTSFAVALLIGEVGVRAFHLVPVNDYRKIVDPTAPWRLRPGSSMMEDQPEFKVEIRINAAGYRDREFESNHTSRVRIALIGDSFTFGTGVAAGERTSERMESELRAAGADCEVYNFGKPGIDTWGAVDVLTRGVAPYHPEFVLLMFYVGNDISDNARRAAGDGGPAAMGAAAQGSLRTRVVRWIRARSQLYQFVVIRIAGIPALSAMFNRMKSANLVGEVADQLEILRRPGADDPRLWQPTREALAAFVRAADSLAIRPVVVLIPARLQYDDDVWSQLARLGRLDERQVSRSMPNELLHEYVKGRLGAQVIDPLAAFQLTGSDARKTYFPINGHFTRLGHELLARQVVLGLRPLLADPEGRRAPSPATSRLSGHVH